MYRADAVRRRRARPPIPLDSVGPCQIGEREPRDPGACDHPDSVQHHGGALVVGPDELLYLGLGDGGGLRRSASGNARGLRRPCSGKVLRIVPTPDERSSRIASRPTTRSSTSPSVAPEIWVIGRPQPVPHRVPTRPRATSGCGDVGQSCWEELDRLPTGADDAGGSNLGWDHIEGVAPLRGRDRARSRARPVQEHAPTPTDGAGSWHGYVLRSLGRTDAGRSAPLLGLLQGRSCRAGRRREHERTPASSTRASRSRTRSPSCPARPGTRGSSSSAVTSSSWRPRRSPSPRGGGRSGRCSARRAGGRPRTRCGGPGRRARDSSTGAAVGGRRWCARSAAPASPTGTSSSSASSGVGHGGADRLHGAAERRRRAARRTTPARRRRGTGRRAEVARGTTP